MEMLLDEHVLLIIAVVFAAVSEIIGMTKLKSNSNVQLVLRLIKRVFNIKERDGSKCKL